MRICEWCGTSIEHLNSRAHYCCHNCQEKARRQKVKQRTSPYNICEKCGKAFLPKKYGATRKYCFDCIPDGLSTGAQIRHQIKLWGIEYKGNKCSICGYDKCLDALEFHHINIAEKEFNISDRNIKLNWPSIKEELDKCILVCCNCHREIHSKIGYNLPKE